MNAQVPEECLKLRSPDSEVRNRDYLKLKELLLVKSFAELRREASWTNALISKFDSKQPPLSVATYFVHSPVFRSEVRT